MINIKEIAKKVAELPEIMEGKEKIDTEEIISSYKKGITINAFDKYVDPEGQVIYVYTFKEDKTVFAFAGLVLAKVFTQIEESCAKTNCTVKEAIDEVGGLKVILSSKETKNGNVLTRVKVCD